MSSRCSNTRCDLASSRQQDHHQMVGYPLRPTAVPAEQEVCFCKQESVGSLSETEHPKFESCGSYGGVYNEEAFQATTGAMNMGFEGYIGVKTEPLPYQQQPRHDIVMGAAVDIVDMEELSEVSFMDNKGVTKEKEEDFNPLGAMLMFGPDDLEDDLDETEDEDAGPTNHKTWPPLEEVILVGCVTMRFFKFGSLTNKKNENCWGSIKESYDIAWKAYTSKYGIGKPNARSSTALKRHFKVMKERITRNDVQNDVSFLNFFMEWENLNLPWEPPSRRT